MPGVGLGGLAPSSNPTPYTELVELFPWPASPILGGLPLTNDDFHVEKPLSFTGRARDGLDGVGDVSLKSR